MAGSASQTVPETSQDPTPDDSFNLEDEVLAMLEEETGELLRESQPAELDEQAPRDVGPEDEDALSEDFLFGSDAETAPAAEAPQAAQATSAAQVPAGAETSPRRDGFDNEVRRRNEEVRHDPQPSQHMRAETEVIYCVDQEVEMRDEGELEWKKGVVTSTTPKLLVRAIHATGSIGFEWDEVRPMDKARRGARDARETPRGAGRPKRGAQREEAAQGGGAALGGVSDAKRRKMEKEKGEPNKGDRVWTHFRCLPKDSPGLPGPPVAVKSAKPELAVIKEEIIDGSVIVQFEKEEHEKERIELYNSRRGRKIHGWLRYPRVFEGKMQRVPLTWVQWKRTPPRLCGCTRQEWAHSCDCGISCGRGSANSVWGAAT